MKDFSNISRFVVKNIFDAINPKRDIFFSFQGITWNGVNTIVWQTFMTTCITYRPNIHNWLRWSISENPWKKDLCSYWKSEPKSTRTSRPFSSKRVRKETMHNGRGGGKNDFETPQFKQGYTLRTGWRESPKKIRLKLVAPTGSAVNFRPIKTINSRDCVQVGTKSFWVKYSYECRLQWCIRIFQQNLSLSL